MTADNRKFSQEFGHESTIEGRGPVDFDFLATQTFSDLALEREVLELFLGQARRVLLALPEQAPAQQADTAHLLKGSARGIGAFAVAEAAASYEAAAPAGRRALMPELGEAVDAAAAAITARLATL